MLVVVHYHKDDKWQWIEFSESNCGNQNSIDRMGPRHRRVRG